MRPRMLFNFRFRAFARIAFAYGGSICTHTVHEHWNPRLLPRSMCTRYSTTLVNRICLNRGPVGDREHAIGRRRSNLCRHGCGVLEDIEHVMLRCPSYEKSRMKLRRRCEAHKLNFDLQTIFCDRRVHSDLEKFVLDMKLPDQTLKKKKRKKWRRKRIPGNA